jgi:hypothetical protein
MVLQQKIPIPASEASASFDYADIQEGKGVTIYNLGATSQSGNSTTYFLTSSEQIYSQLPEISGNDVSSSGLQEDTDFDLEFNRPQNLKGVCYTNVPHYVAAGGVAGTDTGWLKMILKHVDSASAETTLATAESLSISGTAGISASHQLICVPLEITPIKHFKKGEKLRLTVEVHQVHGSNGNGTFAYGSDPVSRTDAWIVTTGGLPLSRSSIHVPFVLKV